MKTKKLNSEYIVLGIDQSLIETGLCIYRSDGMYTLSSIKPKKEREVERLLLFKEKFTTFLRSNAINFAAIEGYAMGIRGGRTFSLGELGGLLKLILREEEIPTIVIPPTQLKKFVTSKGNCQKDLMMKEVYRKWQVDISNNNLADAFGLAKVADAYYKATRRKILPTVQYEREVVNNLIKEPVLV
jgi:crossover junction endodeoxyribonuclease RuvC